MWKVRIKNILSPCLDSAFCFQENWQPKRQAVSRRNTSQSWTIFGREVSHNKTEDSYQSSLDCISLSKVLSGLQGSLQPTISVRVLWSLESANSRLHHPVQRNFSLSRVQGFCGPFIALLPLLLTRKSQGPLCVPVLVNCNKMFNSVVKEALRPAFHTWGNREVKWPYAQLKIRKF